MVEVADCFGDDVGVTDVGISVPGCGGVFPDSTSLHASSQMWRHFCDNCRDNRKPHCDRAAALKRQIRDVRLGKPARAYKSGVVELRLGLRGVEGRLSATGETACDVSDRLR